jgi:hypothetical protein
MNQTAQGLNPFEHPFDRILAEIAFSVQLPPSLHQKAVTRYKAVRQHLEATVAFKDEIEHFYAQGSMAIDATISTRGTDDEYDLDIIAQLGGRFRGMTALSILKELEAGLSDYPVGRIVRQTRCVTLFYADNMHLDVTASLRDHGTLERQSTIAHAKGTSDDRQVPMNAYGHAEWYKAQTPLEASVFDAFKERWDRVQRTSIRADAEFDDVPDQAEFVVKNTATVALQLLKRYRNIRYAAYSGRIPPSVMLSYYAGIAALPNVSLSDLLVRMAKWIIGDIEQASVNRQTLKVVNPVYERDVFTDRWPESISQQNEFARCLKELVIGVERAKRGGLDPVALRGWLREQFGDRVVTKAVDRIAESTGSAIASGSQSYSRRGGILLPTAAASIAAVSPVAASTHTFFGDPVDE